MRPTISKSKSIFKKAMFHYVALLDKRFVSDVFFKYLAPNINVNFIPDRELLENERLKNNINWNAFDNIKIIRLMIRERSILERIEIAKYNFQLKELLPLFIYHPDLVEYFDIDFSNLTSIEAINMLEVNNNFIDKIDLEKYNYGKTEINQIVKKFWGCEKIIEKLNLSNLDHFSMRNLLKKSGSKYIERINTSELKAPDWVEILELKPELIEHCNLLLFEKGDCYLLTKLVLMFPELDYMITQNKNKLSAIGWELLLINDPDKYSKLCEYSLLSAKNWDKIIKLRPELIGIKKKYIID